MTKQPRKQKTTSVVENTVSKVSVICVSVSKRNATICNAWTQL